MAPKRKSYTADFKLSVVQWAKLHGNRAAGREFSVAESSIREWRKSEGVLEQMPPRKRARRGLPPRWPQLEANLAKWVLALRDDNRSVSTVAIRLQAKVMAREMKIENFKGGSPNWVVKFMKRNKLSVRARTTAGQALPPEWEKKMDDFKTFVK